MVDCIADIDLVSSHIEKKSPEKLEVSLLEKHLHFLYLLFLVISPDYSIKMTSLHFEISQPANRLFQYLSKMTFLMHLIFSTNIL